MTYITNDTKDTKETVTENTEVGISMGTKDADAEKEEADTNKKEHPAE